MKQLTFSLSDFEILYKLAVMFKRFKNPNYEVVYFKKEHIQFINGNFSVQIENSLENKKALEDDLVFSFDHFIAFYKYILDVRKKPAKVVIDCENKTFKYKQLTINETDLRHNKSIDLKTVVEVSKERKLLIGLDVKIAFDVLKIFGTKALMCYQSSPDKAIYLDVGREDVICALGVFRC